MMQPLINWNIFKRLQSSKQYKRSVLLESTDVAPSYIYTVYIEDINGHFTLSCKLSFALYILFCVYDSCIDLVDYYVDIFIK